MNILLTLVHEDRNEYAPLHLPTDKPSGKQMVDAIYAQLGLFAVPLQTLDRGLISSRYLVNRGDGTSSWKMRVTGYSPTPSSQATSLPSGTTTASRIRQMVIELNDEISRAFDSGLIVRIKMISPREGVFLSDGHPSAAGVCHLTVQPIPIVNHTPLSQKLQEALK